MTIDEAIKHCEEVADGFDETAQEIAMQGENGVHQPQVSWYQDRASSQRQLAEWLKELQKYRAILDELKDEITRAHNDLIESENEYGENARYTENDRGYLGGLLHAYEMFGREYEEVNADEE